MGVAKWKATSDFRELERDYAKLMKANTKLLQQQQQMTSASKKSQQAQRRLTASVKQGAMQAAGAIFGIRSAWDAATAALRIYGDAVKERRAADKAAADEQRAMAAAQEEQLDNIVSLTKKQKEFVRAQAAPLAKITAFPDAKVLERLLGVAISAGATPRQAVQAGRFAGELTRNRPQDAPEMAKAVVAVMNKSGDKSALATGGMIAATQQASSVENIAKVAENLPRVIARWTETVKNQDKKEVARFASTFFARLSRVGTDTTGEVSRRFSGNFAGALNEFVTKGFKLDQRTLDAMERKGITGDHDDGLVRPQDPGTIQGRIKLLQDPFLREAFFSKAQLGQTKEFIQGITSKEGMKKFAEVMKDIRFDPKIAERRFAEGRTATAPLRTGVRESQTDRLLQKIDLTDEVGAIRASSRRLVLEGLKKLRDRGIKGAAGKTDQDLQDTVNAFTGDKTSGLLRMVRKRLRQITIAQDPQKFSGLEGDFFGGPPPADRKKTPDEMSHAERRSAELLEEILVQLRQNAADEKRLLNGQQNVNKGNANAARGRHLEK
tara:strand:+ start:12181 stop:13833 length:1653 start_codon:yes stop_codon:yes gene_type:complete